MFSENSATKAVIFRNSVLILFLILQQAIFAVAKEQNSNNTSGLLVKGKFGKALDLSSINRLISIDINGAMEKRPVTFQCWVKINSIDKKNMILSLSLIHI